MNFFFGIKSKIFLSKLTIPRYQNSGLKNNNYDAYQAIPTSQNWMIQKVDCKKNNDFFFIENDNIDNNKIFFLASEDEIEKISNINCSSLLNLNLFTDTSPSAYRSNFKISLNGGGFSSYQSEYPFDMILKKGNIFSSVSTLLDNEAQENYILFRNIFHEPLIEKFKIYFINLKIKKILKIEEVYSNTSNLVLVEKNLINENVYIFSDNYLGIPIYISRNNMHLSMEHTHPPHHYILSDNKFKIIKQIKDEIKNIIIQQTI